MQLTNKGLFFTVIVYRASFHFYLLVFSGKVHYTDGPMMKRLYMLLEKSDDIFRWE